MLSTERSMNEPNLKTTEESESQTQMDDCVGYLHSVETGGMADGPGVRFIAFLSGCPLRCVYCHNPDMVCMKDGTPTKSSDLLAEIAKYASFLKRSGGGVTISGGEPLAQPEFTKAILRGCKEMGLHTAIDTSGFLGRKADQEILRWTDLVLLDIKSGKPEEYKRVTGKALQPTLEFATRLSNLEKPMWIRYVLVPGYTDQPDNVDSVAGFVASLKSVERIDILPFHKMGEKKWVHVSTIYELTDTPEPTQEQVSAARQSFEAHGLKAY